MNRSATTIIAEAGVNHNGRLDLAKQLVDLAADAGADYVKFQTFNAERCISRFASKAAYQARLTGEDESQLDMVKKLELSPASHREIQQHCASRSIGFLSTAFDLESVDLLATLNLDFYKIASGEVTNRPLLEKLGALGRPVYLSTGMARLGEVEEAIEVLTQSGLSRQAIVLLHCNTEYPTPYEDANLRAMETMRNAFQLPVGFSDHTLGISVAIAAVALGAVVIEKHLTLDRNLPGPDHQASLEGKEFAEMVHSIRTVEAALGSRLKGPTPSESRNLLPARRSLVAGCQIMEGETFTLQNLEAKRPGHGISPMLIHKVVGSKASRDYQPDEAIRETIF